MYQKFDLQMFDDAPNFDGIDDDIVKELTGDTGEQTSDTHTAEDNSDNKPEQEEQQPNNEPQPKDDEKEPEDNSTIPYSRFKEVNERMKASEARVKELEALMAKAPTAESTKQESPAPAKQEKADGDFTPETLRKITQMAIANVRARDGIDDDKLEEMEYSDDEAAKIAYQSAIQEEVGRIKNEAKRQLAERQELARIQEDTYNAYTRDNAEFMARKDSAEVLKFIENDIKSEPTAQKTMLVQSISRLINKQGTYQDLFVVQQMVGDYIKRYEAQSAPAPKPPTQKQKDVVERLPKAPDIQGGTSGGSLTVEKAEQMIDAGQWDKIPAELQEKLLRGETW